MLVVDAKLAAAEAALGFVKDGMVVGLGSGSTSSIFIRLLGKTAKKKGWRLRCVATSEESRRIAEESGFRVSGLAAGVGIDLAVDGADAVDGKLNLVKGGGGCHAREKVVAYAAKKFVCIVDESKLKKNLAEFPVPLEVLPFAAPLVADQVAGKWGIMPALRKAKDGRTFVTDNGNWILDAPFKRIGSPERLELELNWIPGISANGIFAARKPDKVIVGKKDGSVAILG